MSPVTPSSLTSSPATWKNQSFITVSQLTPSGITLLFQEAKKMRDLVQKEGGSDRLKRQVMSSVFYESSTRTNISFQTAMLRLGGSVTSINESTSSVKKGETLSDTIKCLSLYSDILILRHPEVGSSKIAAEASSKIVINAGDGVGEHPTQALLDLYTIQDELTTIGGVRGKIVVLLGDLKHGRTVHSLARIISLFLKEEEDITEIRYCSPASLQMPQEIIDEITADNGRNIKQEVFTDLDSALVDADILYVTRIQKERFTNQDEYEQIKDTFIVTPATISLTKSSFRILHPLPRVNEIAEEVDSDEKAAYFRQMENGLFVRMALLGLVSGTAGGS